MGFESSQMARRRLAALAANNSYIQEALAPSGFPGFESAVAFDAGSVTQSADKIDRAEKDQQSVAFPTSSSPLDRQLETLARDIIATPGAGGALLASYAAQARALVMVLEACKRADECPLPTAVMTAVSDALARPFPMPDLMAG